MIRGNVNGGKDDNGEVRGMEILVRRTVMVAVMGVEIVAMAGDGGDRRWWCRCK